VFHPSVVKELSSQVKRADVIIGHGHVYMPVVIGVLLARMSNRPFVLIQHNTFIQYRSSALRWIQHAADRTLGRLTLALAHEVVAVSNATRDYVDRIAHIRCTVIYNGVDIARFHPSEKRVQLRSELGIPVDKTICLCIRRVTFKNGIDTLLEVAELLKQRSDMVFLIGGDGPDLHLVRKRVRDKQLGSVRILGAISEADLPRYYAAADMFVLPSKTGEGLPLVVLEALASGLPVIATRSGGQVEMIRDAETGYLVEPGDSRGIAECVVALSDNRSGLRRMQQQSRELAVHELSWEHNLDQLLVVMGAAV
jgi:glycosyltransferase involved in cell wall biosynthesis